MGTVHRNGMLLQVAAARGQSSDILGRAAAISAAVEAEARVRQVQAGLRDQEEQASAAVKVRNSYITCIRLGLSAMLGDEARLAMCCAFENSCGSC